MASRVRVYMACSLDGFIAGPNDDLAFLSDPAPATEASSQGLDFANFLSQVGAMLMGRRTHDVVAGLGAWPYGETPVLVATNRPLDNAAAETVRAVQGDIGSLIRQAQEASGSRDVYVDGGTLVRQALDAALVDELCITLVPVLLGGDGVKLFDGLLSTTKLVFTEHHTVEGGMVQIVARPRT